MVSGLSDKSLNNLIEGQSGEIWVAIFNVLYRVAQKNALVPNYAIFDNKETELDEIGWKRLQMGFKNIGCFNQDSLLEPFTLHNITQGCF